MFQNIQAVWKQLLFVTALLLFINQQHADAHGGVSMDNDMCTIRIGLFKAHFTGYQPQIQASEEFCEDIPDAAESVFVIDYIDKYLQQMPIDFRIIKDINNLGIRATWEDVKKIEDLEAATVHYQSPSIQVDGTLTTNYHFTQAGHYIGLLTAKHPTLNKTYQTVFPFSVGITDYSVYWVIFLAMIVQALYWYSNKKFTQMNKD